VENMALTFCSLASGSSGNCQYIASEDTGLLLDAGLSGKYIAASLEHINADIDKIKGILITHEHGDHVKGAGILMRKFGLDVYVTEPTWNAMASKMGKIDNEKVHFIEKDKVFNIGDIEIDPYSVSHDAVDTVGYSFNHRDGKVSVVTDLGHVPLDLLVKVMDSDLLMIESNHNVEMLKAGKYPYFLKQRILSDKGHISNETAAETIVRAVQNGNKIGHVLLGHLSKDNNIPELAYETVKGIAESNGIKIDYDISLDLTYRDRVGKIYRIG